MANRYSRVTGAGLLWAVLGAPGAATAQSQWVIDIAYSDAAGVINSLDDTATITLWAAWDPVNYAFRQSRLDVSAHDPLEAGNWSDNSALLRRAGFSNGVIDGAHIRDARPVQLHLPDAGLFADTANPIAAWTATWRTSDLTLRSVPVTTESRNYFLYFDDLGNSFDFVDSLSEGSAVINVVPTPATGAAFGVVAFLVGRRR